MKLKNLARNESKWAVFNGAASMGIVYKDLMGFWCAIYGMWAVGIYHTRGEAVEALRQYNGGRA